MKSCIARDTIAPASQRGLRISPLKWLVMACMLIPGLFDPGIVFSATTSVPTQGDPGETSPDYMSSRLVGTMKGRGSSVVVFENPKGEQTFYRMGETFSDGSKIITVNNDSIIVRRSDGSKVEYFVTPGSKGQPGSASAGRPVTNSSAAYIPPGTSDPDSTRAPRPKRYKSRNYVPEE